MVWAQVVATVLLALWARSLVRTGRAAARVAVAVIAALGAAAALSYFGVRILASAFDAVAGVAPWERQEVLAGRLSDGYQLIAIAWGGLTLIAIALAYVSVSRRRGLPTARAVRARHRDRPRSPASE